MKHFSIITAFPQMIEQAMAWGVIGKAREGGSNKNPVYDLKTINPRDFTADVHKTIDDRPFGGGDGMVMLYEPLSKCVESIENHKTAKKIYMSPVGKLLNEKLVNELVKEENLIILCGRYGGVDQRLLNQYEFENVSVGDYVVSGGEVPALILMDAMIRKIPGVLGNLESPEADSFAGGKFFEAPLFTRPRALTLEASKANAADVPAVLLSGDHKKINEWREKIGLALTLKNRSDLVTLSEKDRADLKKYLSKLNDNELELVGLSAEFVRGL